MDIEETKRQWQSLHPSCTLDDEVTRQLLNNRRLSVMSTALDRLIRKYRISTILLPVTGIIVSLLNIGLMRWWQIASLIMFFIIAGLMKGAIWLRLRTIDVCTMNMSQIIAIATLCRRRHHQSMALLLVLAVLIICSIAVTSINDRPMLYAILAGVAIGFCAGLFTYLRLMRNYRRLITPNK